VLKAKYIESPASEREHRQLAALGAKLGIPIPMTFLEMQVKMPGGEIVHWHKQRGHTWVRNAYNLLFSQLTATDGNDVTFGAGKITFKDTGASVGSSATPLANVNTSNSNPFSSSMETSGAGYRGASAAAGNGITVGSGIGAESFEDYKLGTPIAEGLGAGQLNHVLGELPVVTYAAGTLTMTATFVRFLNNNSPGNVVVSEVGLISQITHIGGISGAHLMSRDLLGVAVTIPATGQLKVTYTISLVYPA
jgi:hypothetical protein